MGEMDRILVGTLAYKEVFFIQTQIRKFSQNQYIAFYD